MTAENRPITECSPGEITHLIMQARAGDQQAINQLTQHLYFELKQMAAQRRHSFRNNQTLNTTALVNETWLKLQSSDIAYADKAHFLSVAAVAMRQILLDEAKSKSSQKRKDLGNETYQDGQFVDPLNAEAEWLLQLDLILNKLENHSPRLALVFNLKFFCGLTLSEIASHIQSSQKTAQRDWEQAKNIIANTFDLMETDL